VELFFIAGAGVVVLVVGAGAGLEAALAVEKEINSMEKVDSTIPKPVVFFINNS
jgi:hypothetical protein